MTSIYNHNIQLIHQRWPILGSQLDQADYSHLQLDIVEKRTTSLKVNNILLASAFDPVEEAFSYRSLTSGDRYHIWGLGLGHVPELLLQDKKAQNVDIYIYNLELTKLILSLIELPWLSDSRLNLHWAAPEQPNFMPCLSSLSSAGSIVINSDLSISKDSHYWLYSRAENVRTMRHTHRLQTENDERFMQIEQKNLSILKKLPSIDEYLRYSLKSAICIGAGPSLESDIVQLKKIYQQKHRPNFIAAATACKCLLENGIKPDVVFAIDIDIPESYIPFEIAQNTILVFASRISSSIIHQWHGEKYYLHLADGTYDRINQKLPTAFRPYVYGSVIHPLIHTTLEQGVDIVQLIGCDFGFPNEIIHASMKNDPKDHNSSMDQVIENGHGDLIKTSQTYKMFQTGVETLIAAAPNVRFINRSRMGARIFGTEYLTSKEAVYE